MELLTNDVKEIYNVSEIDDKAYWEGQMAQYQNATLADNPYETRQDEGRVNVRSW